MKGILVLLLVLAVGCGLHGQLYDTSHIDYFTSISDEQLEEIFNSTKDMIEDDRVDSLE